MESVGEEVEGGREGEGNGKNVGKEREKWVNREVGEMRKVRYR